MLTLRMNVIKRIILDENILNLLNNNEFMIPCINGLQNAVNQWNGLRNRNITHFQAFSSYFRYNL